MCYINLHHLCLSSLDANTFSDKISIYYHYYYWSWCIILISGCFIFLSTKCAPGVFCFHQFYYHLQMIHHLSLIFIPGVSVCISSAPHQGRASVVVGTPLPRSADGFLGWFLFFLLFSTMPRHDYYWLYRWDVAILREIHLYKLLMPITNG